eukprot:TRINITY_DN4953_c1_g1_i1.p1 TRINITY_DN4953_c1_g1~~TRINITY_DN4953_c1_g1_i1.p1  ORF type:complete len:208 (+),score=40.45 TRINITY_DN4953_c1_g1_i1:55-624(+)
MSMLTIGHSNNTTESFFGLLEKNSIMTLVDVRSKPASGRFPHFSKENLEKECKSRGLQYLWYGRELGGRGEGGMDVWGHLELPEGQKSMKELESLASSRPSSVAMMCSEGNWHNCHRGVLANTLCKDHGVAITHISATNQLEEHVPVANPSQETKTLTAAISEAVFPKQVEPTAKTTKLKEKKKNRLQR